MAKQKSFHSKLLEKVKRDSKRYWNVKTMGQIKKHFEGITQTKVISQEWENLRGGILPAFQFDAYIRSYYENGVFADMTAEELKDIPFVYPGLMFAWEVMPKAMELDASAIAFLKDAEADYRDAPIGSLKWPFPGCLLIDVRDLGFELYGIKVDGVFVYPSYDLDRSYSMLLMLGVNLKKGMFFPIESKLMLSGDTLGEAMAFSKQESDLLRRRVLSGLDRGIHEELFSPLDDEQLFREFVSRILAFSGSQNAHIEERHMGGMPHIRVSLRRDDWPNDEVGATAVEVRQPTEQVQDEAPNLVSEPPCLEAVDPTVAEEKHAEETTDRETPGDAAEEEGEVSAEGVPIETGTSEENCSNPEALLALVESLQAENGSLREALSAAENQGATLQYHLKQAQASVDRLKAEAEALRDRATLVEDMELPATPLEALALAERAFSDRIIVLDEARKSARAFERGSASEVWSVLRAMATVLHRLVFSGASGSISHAFQTETGFEITLRDVKHTNRNSEYAKERRVFYAGKEHNISPHVKGKGVKKGECLRVHFFADYSTGKIAIAHCGEHLTTIKTSSL